MLIRENLHTDIRRKRESLSLSVQAMARLLSIPAENIYKWQKGTKPTDQNHISKLEMFLNGRFDRFVADGKIPGDYDYDEAIEVLFPRNPTGDFVEGRKNLAAEKPAEYLTEKDFTIVELRNEIEELKQQRAELRLLVKTLSEENERYKSKVIDVGKTGGRRTSM